MQNRIALRRCGSAVDDRGIKRQDDLHEFSLRCQSSARRWRSRNRACRVPSLCAACQARDAHCAATPSGSAGPSGSKDRHSRSDGANTLGIDHCRQIRLAFSFGRLLGAIGPMAIGVLAAATGSLPLAISILAAVCLPGLPFMPCRRNCHTNHSPPSFLRRCLDRASAHMAWLWNRLACAASYSWRRSDRPGSIEARLRVRCASRKAHDVPRIQLSTIAAKLRFSGFQSRQWAIDQSVQTYHRYDRAIDCLRCQLIFESRV